MVENLDQHLFLFLNSLHTPFFDNIMHAASGVLIWVPLYLAILVYLGFRYRRKFLVMLLFIIIAVLLSDQISVQLFKNIFHRLRPCHTPAIQEMVHLVNGECGGMYGFVSSHAANCFNVAVLSLLLIRKSWFTVMMLIWASIVGYSRIYLGVHYPGDVICGAMLGALLGWSLYSVYQLTDMKILSRKPFFNAGKKLNV